MTAEIIKYVQIDHARKVGVAQLAFGKNVLIKLKLTHASHFWHLQQAIGAKGCIELDSRVFIQYMNVEPKSYDITSPSPVIYKIIKSKQTSL